jgi:hypothetical protein
MPHNTSDLHKTICIEMQMAKTMNMLNICHGGTKSSSFVTPSELSGNKKFSFPPIDVALRTSPATISEKHNHSQSQSAVSAAVSSSANHQPPNRQQSFNGHNASNQTLNNFHNSTNADLASVDSSDTFMSCQTHPFLSQGDLTVADDDDDGCSLDVLDANALYTNALGRDSELTRGTSLYRGGVNIVDNNFLVKAQVKKSTSGDTALRSLGACTADDSCKSSRVSLNETPVPKHRKTRFQQQSSPQPTLKPKTRFDGIADSIEHLDTTVNANSNKKNRRASFMPTKIITTATKQLINQHIFGIQSKGESTCGGISLLTQPFSFAESSSETHKRSKSILKNKADSRLADPESERLLSDTGSGVSDISVIPVSFRFESSFCRGNLKFCSLSGRRQHRFLAQQNPEVNLAPAESAPSSSARSSALDAGLDWPPEVPNAPPNRGNNAETGETHAAARSRLWRHHNLVRLWRRRQQIRIRNEGEQSR